MIWLSIVMVWVLIWGLVMMSRLYWFGCSVLLFVGLSVVGICSSIWVVMMVLLVRFMLVSRVCCWKCCMNCCSRFVMCVRMLCLWYRWWLVSSVCLVSVK